MDQDRLRLVFTHTLAYTLGVVTVGLVVFIAV